jgi:outer membrane protein TolC
MNELERASVQRAYAEHVRDLQRTWIDAVATRQRLRLVGESLEAAAIGAELGQRMVQAGNWSQARLLREQLTEAQARQAWTRAAQAQQAATEQLARLLGVWDAQAVVQLTQRLPAQLPEPPAALSMGNADAEAAALRSQPLLAQQRLKAERALVAVSPERLAAWSQAVDEALKTPAAPAGSTPWLAPEIGDPRLVRDHGLEAAVTAESALLTAAAKRRSMAREAWSQLHSQHASALQAQQVLRLQTAQEQETLLRYNGMLQSSWDLLASAGERLNALDAALMARRDFWLAQADWDALLAGADVEPASTGASSDNNNRAAAGGH